MNIWNTRIVEGLQYYCLLHAYPYLSFSVYPFSSRICSRTFTISGGRSFGFSTYKDSGGICFKMLSASTQSLAN